ncbi:hypothetical protein R1sor_007999 [Riccia sorocarpa]|uniref:Uncharacterized protein n=1 Tax=Riccia sorocarpa TaxID=122646 RepID=A0ABD3HSB4_9MARC
MDKQQSNLTLGGSLMSSKANQLHVVIDKVVSSQSKRKLLERESIKQALSSGIFDVLPKDVVHYLPSPELAAKTSVRPIAAELELSDDEDDAIAEDIPQTKVHEAEPWASAKKSHVDKGKAVAVEEPKKKPVSRPKGKLLGTSINAEKARFNRDTQKDSKKRPRESVTPTPPPKPKSPIENWSSKKEKSSFSEEAAGVGAGEATKEDSSDSDTPPPTQTVTKRGAKLKTLKQMDKSHIDKEKKEIRTKAVERCR